MTTSVRPIRVLVAKPGLDGHDVGAKLVCRALMDAGMEVIYTGLRQSPEAIVRVAVQEDVDVVGLSVLSGAHVPLTRKVCEALAAEGAGDVTVLVGGNIPRQDFDALREVGAAGIFPTSTPFDEIVRFVREGVRR
ncbi:MAG: cobalamin B12-binding domain-containing protein [Planctomycetes bacterium]|nr:cobalamin B12-binding domain-containing protein [Planctomycetota bacterium]